MSDVFDAGHRTKYHCRLEYVSIGRIRQSQAWEKEDERLIKAGVKIADRPKAPAPDKEYPTKEQIALALIEGFHRYFPEFKVKAVLADAAFGTAAFMESACEKAGCSQVIRQIKSNQTVVFRNKNMSVKDCSLSRNLAVNPSARWLNNVGEQRPPDGQGTRRKTLCHSGEKQRGS